MYAVGVWLWTEVSILHLVLCVTNTTTLTKSKVITNTIADVQLTVIEMALDVLTNAIPIRLWSDDPSEPDTRHDIYTG